MAFEWCGMSLLKRTKFLLRRYRIFPKKRLGQNFMVEPSVFNDLAVFASLGSDDVVLDVGAGLGFLTRFLAEKCKLVLAVEIDSKLVQCLQEQLKDVRNVKIIKGDVLKVQIPQFNKVVSIPPYHISSQLLQWLFHKNFECAVLIFQKEFTQRLAAPIGSEKYGWLTVVAYYYVETELLDEVPAWMFYPQPEVDSIIVRLKPKKPPPFSLKNEKMFWQLTRLLFTQRNRKVKNAAFSFVKGRFPKKLETNAKMLDHIPFSDRRVRELAPEDFGALANALAN